MKEALKNVPPTDFVKIGDIPKREDQDASANPTELPQDNPAAPPNPTSTESKIDFNSL
jgi:hypothetical protein